MTLAERLRRLLLLFSLLLVALAGPLLFVDALASVALLGLAGLAFGLAFVALARPTHTSRVLDDASHTSATDSLAPLVVAADTAQTPSGDASEEMTSPDEAPVADERIVPPSPSTMARRPAVAWLWLSGALLVGLAIGVLANRVLPAPRADAPAVLLEPLHSPLVSSIRNLEAISSLIESRVVVGDEEWAVLHPALDIGQAADIFDGRPDTLMRGQSANPFIFEVRYPQPKPATGVILHLARMSDFKITITATTPDGKAIAVDQEYTEELVDPVLEFAIPGGAQSLQSVRVEILDRRAPPQEGFHTHVREFRLR